MNPRRSRRAASPTLWTAVCTLVLLAGCAGGPKRQPATVPMQAPRATTSAVALEPPKPSYRGPWEDPASPLYQRTIYFDYDSTEIKPEYIPVMRTHAAYLGTHTSTRVTLEGNTDERGTREYNLALGDQRSETVKRFMVAEGVLPDQISTLSYGEERPENPGHGESSWRRNRRVFIHY